MKSLSISRHAIMTGTALLIALLSVCQMSAATNPLSGPRGLALDSQGNLYVANQSGNRVLVFSPTYATIKTITAGVSTPTGVAVDGKGNIYVANEGNNTVTQYSAAGVQNKRGTISNGVQTPESIAIDGIDNVYVVNNYDNVTIYPGNDYPAPEFVEGALVRTFTPSPGPVFCIATHGQFFAWGSTTQVETQYIDALLGSGAPTPFGANADEALAIAFDQNANLYIVNANQTVLLFNFATTKEVTFATLDFTPAGIAVDNARSRVYISNQQGNAIAVYSTSGALLTTIQ
jgi:ABC-type Fe3+-citrate transport system substrate-binding protein